MKETHFEMQIPAEWQVAWGPVTIVEYHNTPCVVISQYPALSNHLFLQFLYLSANSRGWPGLFCILPVSIVPHLIPLFIETSWIKLKNQGQTRIELVKLWITKYVLNSKSLFLSNVGRKLLDSWKTKNSSHELQSFKAFFFHPWAKSKKI